MGIPWVFKPTRMQSWQMSRFRSESPNLLASWVLGATPKSFHPLTNQALVALSSGAALRCRPGDESKTVLFWWCQGCCGSYPAHHLSMPSRLMRPHQKNPPKNGISSASKRRREATEMILLTLDVPQFFVFGLWLVRWWRVFWLVYIRDKKAQR